VVLYAALIGYGLLPIVLEVFTVFYVNFSARLVTYQIDTVFYACICSSLSIFRRLAVDVGIYIFMISFVLVAFVDDQSKSRHRVSISSAEQSVMSLYCVTVIDNFNRDSL